MSDYTAKSPYCDHQLDPTTAVDGWVTCDCGRRSDARWVSELGWLQARSAWVGARISDGTPWFNTNVGTGAQPVVTPISHESTSQKALYSLGALSLLVAVVVFTAVSWQQLGAIGQALALAALTAVFAVTAIWSRTKLVGLANTSALISSAILLVSLLAAPGFGLLPKDWMEPLSGYPLAVLILVSAYSFVLALKYELLGWSLVTSPLLGAASLLFSLGMLSDYLDTTDFLGLDSQAMTTSISLTLCFAALDRFGGLVRRWRPDWNAFDLTLAGVQAFLLAVVANSTLTAAFTSQRLVQGLGYLLLAAIWGHIAFRWLNQPSSRTDFAQRVLKVAPIVTNVSLALAVSLIINVNLSDIQLRLWISLIAAALVGSLAYRWHSLPIPAKLRESLPTWHSDLFAGVVWVLALSLNLIDLTYPTVYPLVVFFTLISAAGASRWLSESHLFSFVLTAVTGSLAIAILAGDAWASRAQEPEVVTAPTALWLAIWFTVLKRARHGLNTGVWLGIPLAALLLPSAAVSVPMLIAQADPQSWDWIRFWSVALLAVLLTVVGVEKQISGLLWPGVLAYLLVAIPQLVIDLGLVLPRWVFFAFLGLLLIGLAARFERFNRLRREKGSWSEVFR